jgi:preprotein translocase subunit SecF
MFDFVKNQKYFIAVSIILVLASILSFIFWGFQYSVDFKGGSLLEFQLAQSKTVGEVSDLLKPVQLENLTLRTAENNHFIVTAKEISPASHQLILEKLGQPTEVRFVNIGPTISGELITKAWWSIILSVIAILLYVVWAFNKITRIFGANESWKWGAGAIIALLHDVLIMVGLFSILGHFSGLEDDSNFVNAILVVLGYSINDTIVVYDRLREKILTSKNNDFALLVNQSLNETIVRSLNTTFTVLIAILAVFIFGGTSIHSFALAMLVGVTTGAWSSLFIATPFLMFGRASTPSQKENPRIKK